MSSSELPFITRPRGDTADTTAVGQPPLRSTRKPNNTTEAVPTKHESTRKSHHSKKIKEIAIANKELSDEQIEIMKMLNEHAMSNSDRNDKQIEIVAKLNEHSLSLVNIILLVAVFSIAWALYEIGYFGNQHIPTKCF